MKLTIINLFLVIAFTGFSVNMQAQDDRFQCDESCAPSAKGAVKYNVVCPVDFSTVKPIEMAPRLNTLNGKTIAIVGEDFMYNITHPELKRLIKEYYPTAKVIMYDELPIAGPYPAPGITRQSTEQFRQRLIDLKVDAVIAGNGGCGICTPKETGSCIVAERLGIPTVIVTAPGFDEEARYTARNNGVPVLRIAVYPGDILKEGYHTIGSLEDALIENSRRPAYERALANYYANPGSRKDGGEHSFNQYLSHIIRAEGGKETSTPAWYDTQATTMTTVPTMKKGATAFLITGDASRNKVQTMPGGGFSTVRIDLPAAWDSLMAVKGYPALKDMHL